MNSNIELMAGGQFRILNGQGLARNLPGGGQQGPQMTEITVTAFSGIYSTASSLHRWTIAPAESEGAFIITNAGSGNKAYVRDEEKDADVLGYSEDSTKFAIERSGSGEYTGAHHESRGPEQIKAVNKDLLWTVGDNGSVSLEPANGNLTQHFHFERALN
ncbi:hypothetical protein D9619_003757 [Psilocybe cf. subviscida]|uniref:Uncharacterized protein n=1 Tax=Psilocybe cf. subviscida TaxID=2480587 RepID=A0A8H5AX36_9AGAR|nr:hypothetical protein D9619_003757 [Psilocybe cf. subviscida]